MPGRDRPLTLNLELVSTLCVGLALETLQHVTDEARDQGEDGCKSTGVAGNLAHRAFAEFATASNVALQSASPLVPLHTSW